MAFRGFAFFALLLSASGILAQTFDWSSVRPIIVHMLPLVTYHFEADPNKHANVANATHDDTCFPKLWANAQLLGQLAKDRDTAGLLPYIGTENVARDMLRIIETAGQEKLLYWGASYGTVLGATFATMFPDRIERMVSTVSGHGGLVLGCVAAGPAQCAFHADSISEIQANLESLYDSISASPVPVYDGFSVYGTVDYNVLKNAVVMALYEPAKSYPLLAQAWLRSRRGTERSSIRCRAEAHHMNATRNPVVQYVGVVERSAVRRWCRLGGSAADLVAYWNENKDYSSFADVMAASRVACMGGKSIERAVSWAPSLEIRAFLFLSSEIRLTRNTTGSSEEDCSAFPGAVVLTQDSPGHASFAVQSNCTDPM
ncbi:hypothetical protein CPB85DRAFT_1562210 [Mucidula mucida]|nr:hypothetical protein CPB85DRAFT_1562210 [Mucidula mucida]